MAKILYVGPFVGELGWEIGNWIPHVNWVKYRKGPFDKTIAYCKPDHKVLYDADKYLPLIINEGQTECNAFLREYPDCYTWYKQIRSNFHADVAKLRAKGNEVITVELPIERYRIHGFKHKRWVPIYPDPVLIEKWRKRVGYGFVLCPVRAYGRSPQKNTPTQAYEFIHRWSLDNAGGFVTIGKQYDAPEGAKKCPEYPVRGRNLMGKTTLADVAALMRLSMFVVGSSTGPMHMAAQLGAPHIVWGGGQSSIGRRYTSKWNRLGTPCLYLGTKWSPDLKELGKAMDEASDMDNPTFQRQEWDDYGDRL
jgi:hypothetical protein